MIVQEDYLEHTGVLGMHWGKHNSSNSIAGEHNHSKKDLSSIKILDKLKSKEKSKAQQSKELEYIKQGMTKDQAAVAAYQNIRTKKILIGIGSTVLAAGAGYAAYKIHNVRIDKIIKSGELFKNVKIDSTKDWNLSTDKQYRKGVKDAFDLSTIKAFRLNRPDTKMTDSEIINFKELGLN